MAGFRIGDRVSWDASQGRIVAKRERDFDLDGQHFAASPAVPVFIVQSESNGSKIAHAAEGLTLVAVGGGGEGGGGEGR